MAYYEPHLVRVQHHVNYFTFDDFERHAIVIDRGEFASGEWAWVLLELDPVKSPNCRETDPIPATSPLLGGVRKSIEALLTYRQGTISSLGSTDRTVVLWGAAAKGVVAAHALQQPGVALKAVVDADPNKWGLFLECSGVEVWDPASLRRMLARDPDLTVRVVNPRHVDEVRRFLGSGAGAQPLSEKPLNQYSPEESLTHDF